MSEPVALLLVDDRPENLLALEAVLADDGFDLVKAASGNDALRWVLKREFALVLLDVQMPGMDGFETAELMRANPKTRHLPIIFVTAGMKELQLQFKGYELGAVDYLIKPFEPVVLLSKVRVFCELYRQRRQLERDRAQLEVLIKDRVAQLRSSEERFRQVATHAPVGIFQCDSEGECLYVNPSWCEMAGLSAAAAVGQGWTLTVHPDDRAAVSAAWRQTRATGYEFSLDHRYLHPDGDVRWVQASAVALRDGGGTVSGYLGNTLDITERKRSEDDLQIAASVHHAIGEAITITDADNRIIAINPAFTRLTGYTTFEAVGRDPRLLKSGRHDQAFYAAMWRSLNDTGSWAGEIWNRRKNGEEYPEWLSINTLYNADGKVLRRIALFSDITEKKRAEETIWRQANYDPLTDLPNRRLFQDRLRQEMRKAQRAGVYLAVLFIDLDRFKEVNDTLGHQAGDTLLVEAARRICECVRTTDTVARLGGDEFTVIMSDLADTDRIGEVAQEMLAALATPFELQGETAYISGSIGITVYPSDTTDMESLLKHADQAMYAAKAAGRNRFSYFTGSMQETAQRRLQLSNDLHGALAAGQLEVHFQPIVDLASGSIVKAEALMRWNHPELGAIGPGQFIALAEDSGLIGELGDWVFRESAKMVKRWHLAGGTQYSSKGLVQVSVNKSPRQFFSGNTQETWLDYLKELELPPGCINIEITEGLLLDDRPEVADKLVLFRNAGMPLSLDDFGTGYSAMSYLKKFQIDYLKIDQSFVRDLATDPGDKAIAEAIIVMAHKLGIKVIAEGVETEEQRQLLLAAGCDYGQGYLFSRPCPADEFVRLWCQPQKPLSQP